MPDAVKQYIPVFLPGKNIYPFNYSKRYKMSRFFVSYFVTSFTHAFFLKITDLMAFSKPMLSRRLSIASYNFIILYCFEEMEDYEQQGG